MAQVATMNLLENRTDGPVLAGFGGTISRAGSYSWDVWRVACSIWVRRLQAISLLPELAYQCGVSCIVKMRMMP